MISTIQIGYGNAARLHRDCLQKEDVELEVMGVVDIDEKKIEKAKKDGFEASKNLEYFEGFNPLFIDICTPTETHFSTSCHALEIFPKSHQLIEKPVGVNEDCFWFNLWDKKHPEVKKCVNENYRSSNVSISVKEMTLKYALNRPKIKIEFSKNRIKDVYEGRFIDKQNGALGYEGPHEFTVVESCMKNNSPERMIDCELGDMTFPDGRVVKNQGYGRIRYETKRGCEVDLFTSMMGKIKFPIEVLNPPKEIPFGDNTKYRIISLEEDDIQIVGQYEPMTGYERSVGRVFVKENGKVIEKMDNIKDNSMGTSQLSCINYFQGKTHINPSSIKDAMRIVEIMNQASGKLIIRKVA